MPSLAKYINFHFNNEHLEKVMKAVLQYVNNKDNKDKSQGFLSLGKMSLLVEKRKFLKYINEIFGILKNEILQNKKSSKATVTLEVLTCIKMILRNFGEEFEKMIDIIKFTNDMFYSGFSTQLIDTL